MKNFTKAALIVAAVLVILGCAFCAVSLGIGFSFPEFLEEVELDNVSLKSLLHIPFIHKGDYATETTVVEEVEEAIEEYADEYADEYVEDYMEHFVGNHNTDHGVQEEAEAGTGIPQEKAEVIEDIASERKYFSQKDIKELEVKAYRGIIEIVGCEDNGRDEVCVELSYRKDDHMRDITMYMDGKTLHVEEEAEHGVHTYHNDSTVITISIPWSMMEAIGLEEIELEQESGTIYIDTPLTAKVIGINVEEGECIASGKLTATKTLDVELGAGNMQLNELEAQTLKLTVGAGEIYADPIVNAEKVNMKCGMGTLEAIVAGKEDDYSFDLKCGVGTVEVGKNSFSGIAGKKKIENSGSKKMDVECGMGTVNVQFLG